MANAVRASFTDERAKEALSGEIAAVLAGHGKAGTSADSQCAAHPMQGEPDE